MASEQQTHFELLWALGTDGKTSWQSVSSVFDAVAGSEMLSVWNRTKPRTESAQRSQKEQAALTTDLWRSDICVMVHTKLMVVS